MTDKFNYVIARMWFEDSNQMNCYTYRNTVFYGTLEDANNALEFIKSIASENVEEYKIYKINDEPL